MNKKFLAALAVGIAGLAFLFFLTQSQRQPSGVPSAQETATSANSTTRTSYVFQAQATGTVIDAMRAYASTTQFEFKTKEYKGLGAMVEEINGKPSANGFYWILYVNGTTTSEGASTQRISSGDVIEWRYEKGY